MPAMRSSRLSLAGDGRVLPSFGAPRHAMSLGDPEADDFDFAVDAACGPLQGHGADVGDP